MSSNKRRNRPDDFTALPGLHRGRRDDESSLGGGTLASMQTELTHPKRQPTGGATRGGAATFAPVYTSLMKAAAVGDEDLVSELLEEGVCVPSLVECVD